MTEEQIVVCQGFEIAQIIEQKLPLLEKARRIGEIRLGYEELRRQEEARAVKHEAIITYGQTVGGHYVKSY